MRFKLATALAVIGLASATGASAQLTIDGYDFYQWESGSGGNDHWYAFERTVRTWGSAHTVASIHGWHLASLGSEAEEDFIISMFGTSLMWIGFLRPVVHTDFVWTDGSAVTYTNWSGGEPNDCCGGEPVAIMNWGANGSWNDWSSEAGGYAVYERVVDPGTVTPEPVTMTLLGTGLAAVAAARRRRAQQVV
jgi:hypothetical protein